MGQLTLCFVLELSRRGHILGPAVAVAVPWVSVKSAAAKKPRELCLKIDTFDG